MSGADELTFEEVRELAIVFASGSAARALLRGAGFPMPLLPAPTGSLTYWEQVAEEVANGALEDGRRKILRWAADRYPANKVFQAYDETRQPLRVLFLGANPRGDDRLRWDRELKAVQAAGGESLTMEIRPAASVLDLDQVPVFQPHVLHFVGHGEDASLVFEDLDGEHQAVPAKDVVATLMHGPRVRLVLLSMCHGDKVAGEFSACADTVIAFRGRLDDTCATVFAGLFYSSVAQGSAFAAAARRAAQQTANLDAGCSALPDQLVILPK